MFGEIVASRGLGTIASVAFAIFVRWKVAANQMLMAVN